MILAGLSLAVSIVVMLTTHANVLGLVALLGLSFTVLATFWLAWYGWKSADEDGVTLGAASMAPPSGGPC